SAGIIGPERARGADQRSAERRRDRDGADWSAGPGDLLVSQVVDAGGGEPRQPHGAGGAGLVARDAGHAGDAAKRPHGVAGPAPRLADEGKQRHPMEAGDQLDVAYAHRAGAICDGEATDVGDDSVEVVLSEPAMRDG